jgi:hypothetical protein
MAITRKRKTGHLKARESNKLKAVDIELAVSEYLNPRTNLIVPNVHWGLDIHECDLLVITKAGYAWEVEIKVSKADLMKDGAKRHDHKDRRIKDLWFAIPKHLEPFIEHVPERAGIILVDGKYRCKKLRDPVSKKRPYKFSDEERYNVARLGALRIWGLKQKIRDMEIKAEEQKRSGEG